MDWNGETITSSGTFGSDGFDLAAAFGPVRGLAGKIVFTDLINLTTAPDQTVTIAVLGDQPLHGPPDARPVAFQKPRIG